MRQSHRYVHSVSLKRTTVVVLCSLLVLVAGAAARAQSGRRVTKKPPAASAPPPATQPATQPTAAKADKEQISLYVCSSQHDMFGGIPYYYPDTIRNVFVQRLRQSSALNVEVGGELHRTQAVKRAKAETSTYVVLLELDTDTLNPRRSTSGDVDPSSLFIRFYIFSPVTGKLKLQGHVYQQQHRIGRGGVAIPTPGRNNPLYSDYLLKDAAREAADQVLKEFGAGRTPRVPGLESK